jgi:L,D-transpeptidase YcbB
MIARTVSGVTLAAFFAAASPLAVAQEEQTAKPPANPGVEAAQAVRPAPDPLSSEEKDEPVLAPGATEKPAEVAETPPAEEQNPIPAQVLARLGNAGGKGDAREDVSGLTAYYRQTKGQPIWTSKDGFSPNAQKAVKEIRGADDWGLDASAFQPPANPDAGAAPEALADAEIKLSLAVLKYARHARGGRLDPPSISEVMDRRPHLYDPKSVLQGIAAAESPDAYLRGLHPKHEQFKRLRQALLALGKSGTSESASSPVRIPPGPSLRPGVDDPQIALIRRRLQADLEAPNDTVYDAALVEAVKRYQKEHGLGVTGVIDKKLRASLNESVSASPDEKKMRILVNMERWRWMPDNLGEFYVWNSLTEQITRVFDHGKMTLMERIVVGKPTSQTPSFTANMQFVIFHPEWGVPDGIKVNEIAPKLRRAGGGGDFFFFGGDGGSSRVLQRLGLRVTLNGREVDPDSVDWSSVDVRRYQFIQSAGARNVLGVVKFRFPNKHDVYMHDTPDRHLFGAGQRAFSHGCMRTQNPVHLAEVVLAHDKGYTPAQVRQMVDSSETNEIKLTSEIPVHVVYFTAEADERGQLRTFPDLYGLDAKVASALKGQTVRFPNDPVIAADNQDQRRTERPEQRAERGEPWGHAREWGSPRDRQRWGPFGRPWNPFESWN